MIVARACTLLIDRNVALQTKLLKDLKPRIETVQRESCTSSHHCIIQETAFSRCLVANCMVGGERVARLALLGPKVERRSGSRTPIERPPPLSPSPCCLPTIDLTIALARTMTTPLFPEWSHAVSSQPLHDGELLSFTTSAASSSQLQQPPFHQQLSIDYDAYYDDMLPQQHSPYQRQQQQPMASPSLSGYTEAPTSFTASMNNMWQLSPNFTASRYNEADHNGNPQEQQHPLMISRMPSGYNQLRASDMAPMDTSPMSFCNLDMLASSPPANVAANRHQQQPAMPSRRSPGHPHQQVPMTPPRQQQRAPMMPRRLSGYTQEASSPASSIPIHRQLPTPPTPNLKFSPQGLKRSADDSTRMPSAKRQATFAQNGTRTSTVNQSPQAQMPQHQMAVINAKLLEIKEKRGDAAYLKAATEFRQAWQAYQASLRPGKDRAAEAKRVEQENVAELRRIEQQKQEAARVEWQKANEARRRQVMMDAEVRKREEAAQKMRDEAEAEKLRVAQEERLERERRAIRREQLRTDPASLYRNYYEYLEYFPVEQGEPRNFYCMQLLANRRLFNAQPGEDSYEAIMYAKDNWEMFLPNKDYDIALKLAREKNARLAADALTSTVRHKASKD